VKNKFFKLRFFLKLAVLLGLGACATKSKPIVQKDNGQLAFRATFGSCNREDQDQSYWNKILEKNPNVWIWLGDAIYADTKDLDLFKSKYQKLLTNPHYSKFSSQVQITGTWDDHDFGENDAGSEYLLKDQSRELFWDFMGFPASSSFRNQKGIYRSETWSVVGQRVKLIILDERTFRDPLKKEGGSYEETDGDMLGADQWVWLEKELKESDDFSLLLIASGTQFLNDRHSFEKWSNFPKSRERLMNLLKESRIPSKIILSGDRHFAEFAKTDLSSGNLLYELTSSGLTHSYRGAVEYNPYRTGNLWNKTNFGVLDFLMRGQELFLNAYVVDMESGERVVDLELPLPQAPSNLEEKSL
jgi:alkaline phosphatase D